MKIALSIPDDLHYRAERLAAQFKIPRSQLYARAIKKFLAEEEHDNLTEQINRALAEIGEEDPDEAAFRREAARQALLRAEW